MKQQKITNITFLQHSLPALEAGEYQLELKQKVSFSDKDEYVKKATILVNGPRFSFPPELIVQAFPPAETTGDYTSIIPHIVLKSRTLPWERNVDTKEVDSGATVKDEPSWLALLVFDQTDHDFRYQDKKSGAPFRVQQGTIEQLFNVDEDTLSYFTAAKVEDAKVDLAKDLLYNLQASSDPCRFIDIPVGLFKEIAPTRKDLPWLSHNQKGLDKRGSLVSEHSVLMANRLAKEGSMTTVHLVSLEGMGQYLPDDKGEAPAIADKIKYVRLVSLHHWTFNPEPVQLKFSTHLKNLNYDAERKEDNAIEGLLRMPQRDSGHAVLDEKNKTGFVGLLHELRTGDQQFSWYRGPLSPQKVKPLFSFKPDDAFHLPVRAADELMVLQQSTGLFTASYAAAWQLGRLLALSNKSYATTLYNWKAQQLRAAMMKVRKAADTSSARQRKGFYADLIKHLGDPKTIRDNNDTPKLPATVLEWLKELISLRSIPFHYLVPRSEMLPKESLKFFSLDINWLACLLDGALSMGRSSQVQWAFEQAFLADYFDQVIQAAEWGVDHFKDVVVTGLLWRSAGVKGWDPDITINVYQSTDNSPKESDELDNIRLENLAPEVKIGLYRGQFSRVNIHEPAIGTHFGILPELDADDHQRKELCHLTETKDAKVGKPLLDDKKKQVTVLVPLAKDARDAIPIAGLAANIKGGLPQAPEAFTSAEFALQMIEGMEQVGFLLR
ncbi:MAG: hypothetical protein AAF840_00310 [Bacteroidota bacterium]